MSEQQQHGVAATADLTVRVPIDREGDLKAGVARMLARVDDVAAIDVVDLTGVAPQPNAIHTDARVQFTMRLATPVRERAVAALEDEVGVDVGRLRVQHRAQEEVRRDLP